MTKCRTGNATEPVGFLIGFFPRAMAQAIVLTLVLLPSAHADIYSKFRETYAGQGYVVAAEDGGRVIQIKLIGRVTTTNRTVKIIRLKPKPGVFVATGRLLSEQPVLSGTQRVVRVAGTLPPKVGDVAFLAPRVTGETQEPIEDPLPEPEPSADPEPVAQPDDAEETHPPVAPSVPESAQEDLQDWRRALFAATRDSLTREWISRLDHAIESWTPGNDFRIQLCVKKVRQLEGKDEPAYLLLMFEFHLKAGKLDKAQKALAALQGRIDAQHLEELRNQLKEQME